MATQWGSNPFREEERPSFLKSILSEIGKDLKGTLKVVGSVPGTALDLLPNVESPLTFEDLTGRDWAGALFTLGGMAVPLARAGQLGANAARATAMLGTGTRIQQTLKVAGAEALVGAAVGALRPLEDSERRMQQVIGDAALFGLGGGVFEGLGQTWGATVGARLATVKRQSAALESAAMARQEELERVLSETMGRKFIDPNSGQEAIVKRMMNGEVGLFTTSNINPTFKHKDFNTVLSDALNRGFITPAGVARSQLSPSNLERFVPEQLRTGQFKDIFEQTKEKLVLSGGDASAVIPQLQLGNYAAARSFLNKRAYSDYMLEALSAEAAVPIRNEMITIPSEVRDRIFSALPPRQAGKLRKSFAEIGEKADSFILREAIMQGVVDVQHLADGLTLKNFRNEVLVNNALPRGTKFNAVISMPTDDAGLMMRVLSRRGGLLKFHPEAAPVVNTVIGRNTQLTLAHRAATQLNQNFRDTVAAPVAAKAMKTALSTVGQPFNVARTTAMTSAADDAERAALKHVFDMTERHQLRRIAAGEVGTALSADEASVAAARAALGELISQQQSLAAFDPQLITTQVLMSGGRVGTAMKELLATSPFEGIQLSSVGDATVKLSGQQIANFSLDDVARHMSKLRQDILDNGTGVLEISASAHLPGDVVAAASLEETGVLGKLLGHDTVTLPFDVKTAAEADSVIADVARILAPKNVNLANIIADPYKALDLYSLATEHRLAYNGLVGEVEKLMQTTIPSGKAKLRERLRAMTNLTVGRKTAFEREAEVTLSSLGVKPGQIRKFASWLRWAQSNAKLGGLWSGVVNSTQIINVISKRGLQGGMDFASVMLNGKENEAIRSFITKTKADLGFHFSPLDDARLAGEDSVSKALRSVVDRAKHIDFSADAKGVGNTAAAARDLVERMWMWSFNTAESTLRFGTFGAELKSMARAKGVSLNDFLANATKAEADDAARRAEALVKQTQFDYSSPNIPEILQGPVASVLGQFKSFIVFEAEFIAGLTQKERMTFASALMATGGLSSFLMLPGVDVLDAAGVMFADKKMSEGLAAADIQTQDDEDVNKVVRLASYGLPGLVGVDLSNYLGPGSIWEMTRGLLGPTGSDLGSFATFVKDAGNDFLVEGHINPRSFNKFARAVAPSQLRRINDGLKIMDTGEIRNPYSGKLLYRPEERFLAAVQSAVGASHTDVESQRRVDDFIQRQTLAYRDVRESYRRQIATAIIRGDTQTSQLLQARARQSGILFDANDLRRAVRSFSRDAEERRNLRTPTDLRERFLEETGDLF